MINEPTTVHERVRALTAAVRDGELTPERRGHVADLPRSRHGGHAGAARPPSRVTTARRWLPDRHLGAGLQRDFAELAATVGSSVEGHAA